MGKLFGYHTLGVLLKSLSDSCFRADEQEKRGEKVTACGMSSDEIEDLCENYLPYALNPMLSTEEVKEKLHVSDATLNRMVARGDIPNGECKKRGHTRYFKKWDILHFIKSIVEHVSIPYKLSKRGKWLPLFFVSVCVSDCCKNCNSHSDFLFFVFTFSKSLLYLCTQYRNSPHIVCRSPRSHLLFR